MTNTKEIVYGIHSVINVLKNKKRSTQYIFIEENKRGPKFSTIMKLARKHNVKIFRKEKRDLDRACSKGIHQGVVAFSEPLSKLTLHEAIEEDRNNKKSVWLAVDEITDPQNFGTMLRSAVCFDAAFVILPHHRTVSLTSAVYKAACGAMEKIKIVEVSNLNWALLNLKEKGYWIYGADMEGSPLNKVSYNTPAVLIIGSEDKGIRSQTKKHCDELITIPQVPQIQSLNAACAASVILYDIYSKIKIGK